MTTRKRPDPDTIADAIDWLSTCTSCNPNCDLAGTHRLRAFIINTLQAITAEEHTGGTADTH